MTGKDRAEEGGSRVDRSLRQIALEGMRKKLRRQIENEEQPFAPAKDNASSQFDIGRLFDNMMTMKMMQMLPHLFDSQQHSPPPREKGMLDQWLELEMIKSMWGNKSDVIDFLKVYELMDNRKNSGIDSLRDEIKDLRNTQRSEREKQAEQKRQEKRERQKEEDAKHKAQFKGMQAQIDAIKETRARAGQSPPPPSSTDDRVKDMISDAMAQYMEKYLSDVIGVDLSKPASAQRPSDLDFGEQLIKVIPEVMDKILRGIEEMRRLQSGTAATEQHIPASRAVQPPSPPPAEQNDSQPATEGITTPEQPQIPAGHIPQSGDNLDTVTARRPVKSKPQEDEEGQKE